MSSPDRRDDTAGQTDLLELANVGPAVARHLARVGITRTDQLAGLDPVEMYDRLCALDGRRYDPCLLDTFMSAVEQAGGGPARPWWDYTAERKRLLSGRVR
ncbi:helix-hairpin-helix domain-containing protein [Streptosporangium roseum]|uniref:helix-hairpin-helix domain-containing protein n=1 Tax=Streptosporangium roseum TaxID=2001 RepID=UPI0033218F4F